MRDRLAIFCLTNLGDGVLLSPALSALAEHAPEVEVVLVAKPSVCNLYACDNRIAHFVPFVCSWFPGQDGGSDGLRGFLRTARRIRKLGCKVGLNTASDTRTNFLARISNIKRLISAKGRHGDWLSTEIVAHNTSTQHEADRQMFVASAFLAKTLEPYPHAIQVSSEDEKEAECLLGSNGLVGVPLVAIHPGANVSYKAWPAERFAAVGKHLVEARGCRIVLLGHSGAEMECADSIVESVGSRSVSLAGKTPLRVLFALLKRCAVFIGNDSGPMHVAAAAGCLTVALFGSTNSLRWAPYLPSDTQRVVTSPLLAGVSDGNISGRGEELLLSISVDMVIGAIDSLWPKVLERRSAVCNGDSGSDLACREESHRQ